MADLKCLWVDDDVTSIEQMASTRPFAAVVEARVVSTCEEGEATVESWTPDLVVLDVVGADGASLVRRASEGPLTEFPWLLVSDEARHERVPDSVQAICVSHHLMELDGGRVAMLLSRVASDLRSNHPAPSRHYLAAVVHDARRDLESARLELFSSNADRELMAQVDRHLGQIAQAFDRILLQ